MSSRVSGLSSTRIGRRPCSSGSRSDGFDMWKAPDAMNRMWSVFTAPCLVETVVPSISGSRSRCTPSRETSRADAAFAAGDLVDLVEEDDAVLLDRLDGVLHQMFLIEQLVGLLGDEDLVRLLHGDASRLGAAAAELAEDVADVDGTHLRAGHSGNFEHRHAAAAGRTSISISLSFSSPARSFLRNVSLVEALAFGPTSASTTRISAACSARDLHVLALLLAGQGDADLDQVAHDLLDVAADIAHLGELGRLDLDERRAGQPRQPPRNLGLADAGRADHQDVLRQHLLAQLVVELLASPAVAQRDGDGALGVGLADDEAVQLGDDFAGREVGHCKGGPLWRQPTKTDPFGRLTV